MGGRKNPVIGYGVVLVVLGLALVWSGLAPLSQDRDPDGYLMSDPLTIDRASHAVITHDVALLRGHFDCAGEGTFLLDFYSPDDVRMQGVAAGSEALFLGPAAVDSSSASSTSTSEVVGSSGMVDPFRFI